MYLEGGKNIWIGFIFKIWIFDMGIFCWIWENVENMEWKRVYGINNWLGF